MKMRSWKPVFAAAVMSMSLGGAAVAADLGSDYTPPSEGGWYLRGDLGWSWLNWDGGEDDGALAWGGGLGYAYGNGLRADLRLERAGEYDGGAEDFSTTTALINGYYDFQVSEIASPYIGVGAGWGWAGNGKTGDDDGFAYAAMAGLNLQISSGIIGDVGYRYREVQLKGADLPDHSIMAGVRFSF